MGLNITFKAQSLCVFLTAYLKIGHVVRWVCIFKLGGYEVFYLKIAKYFGGGSLYFVWSFGKGRICPRPIIWYRPVSPWSDQAIKDARETITRRKKIGIVQKTK